MKRSEQIRAWLVTVESALVSALRAQAAIEDLDIPTAWELQKSIDYLRESFEFGLTAHGQAILAENLTESPTKIA